LQTPSTIAYLAPEIPALSATFVYEEILALERRGYRIVPFTVRKPSQLATNQEILASRVICLYGTSVLSVVISGFRALTGSGGGRLWSAMACLAADVSDSGLFRPSSWKLIFQFFAAAKLSKMLKREQCRHLHVHFAHTPAQIAMYASALSGIPFTITAHANDIFERGTLLRQKADRARHLLTISEFNQKYLESLGIPPRKLAVVRCGVSFQPRTAPALHGFQKPFRIGSLGRMVEKKGFDVLLKAIKELHSTGFEVTLEIAGDGPLREQLAELAANLALDGMTRFVGSLPHDKVAPWLQTLDAFVLACKMDKSGDMDGIPVVLMEAMSQLVPVVSSRISGIPELVIDEVTGLLATPDDHSDLARQIRRIAQSRDFSLGLARAAATHVIAEFGQDSNLDRLLAAFDGRVEDIRQQPRALHS
jgi:colanic acid/amylovoran biosynthesis glycosyltransferase